MGGFLGSSENNGSNGSCESNGSSGSSGNNGSNGGRAARANLHELQALFIVGTSYKLAPAGECLVSGAYHRTFLSAIGCPWCRRKRAKSYCMEWVQRIGEYVDDLLFVWVVTDFLNIFSISEISILYTTERVFSIVTICATACCINVSFCFSIRCTWVCSIMVILYFWW